MYSDNPHYYHIKNKSRSIGLKFNILSYPQCFSDLNIPYKNSPAYIAHYTFQSEETYLKRKIDKIADDGTKRDNMGKDIHNHFNNVINLQPQKYVNKIKNFLQKYS
jgi:hypothetical protein